MGSPNCKEILHAIATHIYNLCNIHPKGLHWSAMHFNEITYYVHTHTRMLSSSSDLTNPCHHYILTCYCTCALYKALYTIAGYLQIYHNIYKYTIIIINVIRVFCSRLHDCPKKMVGPLCRM